MTPSASTLRTTPPSRLRADSCDPVLERGARPDSRSTSDRGTMRRLAPSRTTRMRRSRSHRRRVSRLTPRARAAWPTGSSRPGALREGERLATVRLCYTHATPMHEAGQLPLYDALYEWARRQADPPG